MVGSIHEHLREVEGGLVGFNDRHPRAAHAIGVAVHGERFVNGCGRHRSGAALRRVARMGRARRVAHPDAKAPRNLVATRVDAFWEHEDARDA